MKKEFYFHILFWICYSALFTFVEGGYSNKFKEAFYIELGFLPFRLAVFYFNYFWLIPRTLLKKKVSAYIIFTTISIIIAAFLHRMLMYNYLDSILFPAWDHGDFWQVYRFLQSAMIILSPMFFLIGLVIMNRWISSERRAEMLEGEKLKAELSYLRSQINPHFFFNTLNTLYGLALKKSDETPSVVMKLSELMSYVLYDSDKDFVTLSKEIEQIERYIALEQIRYKHRFTVTMDVSGDIEDFYIPPLILLPFVENSFKHGINKSSKDGWIAISIQADSAELHFTIKNRVFDIEKINDDGRNGLGIKNVQKRLNLLYPEDRYQLTCEKSEDVFSVDLRIRK